MSSKTPTIDDGDLNGSDHPLPLTELAGGGASEVDEQLVRVVVDAFYNAVRDDDVLGPIFAQRVTDWTKHLAKMCDFWSTLTLRTGRYSGRPLEVHARIPDLRDEHFDRWLQLWRATIENHVSIHARHRFVYPATRMAHNLSFHCIKPEKCSDDHAGIESQKLTEDRCNQSPGVHSVEVGDHT